MIKVLFFINTLEGGGAEKALIELARNIDKKNYECTIVSVIGGKYANSIPEKVRYKCILTHDKTLIGQIAKKVVFKLPPKLFSALFIKDKYNIEVAYLQGFPTHIIANRRTDKRIAFVHSDVSASGVMHRLYKNIGQCLKEYQSFNQVCFVSNDAKNGFFNSIGYLQNARVVHNVIDPKRIRELSRKECESVFNDDGFRVISVGRLNEPKRFDRIVLIAKTLKDKGYKCQFAIIGDGDLKSQLTQMVKQYMVEDVVKLVGYRDNPYPYYKQADVFLCSSDYEGYSTAVSEAVMLGVPVITTMCSGMSEILDGGKYGVLVNRNNDEIENAIINYMTNETLFQNAKKLATERMNYFSIENSIQEYDSLFNEVMNGSNS